MKRVACLLFFGLILATGLSASIREKTDLPRPAYASDRIKIKLSNEALSRTNLPTGLYAQRDAFGIEELDLLLGRAGGTKVIRAHRRVFDRAWEQATGFDRWFIVTLDGRASVRDAIEAFRSSPYVEEAEFEYFAYPDAVPNDPFYDDNWGHNNTAQFPSWNSSTYTYTGPLVGTAGFDSHAEEAWEYGYGSSSIVIAIIDSGVDTSHPDLTLVAGYDYGVGDSNPMDDATDAGHGTLCAGVAAGKANNSLGVAGIAGGCSIMPIKVAAADGSMSFTSIANAITHAADNGAHIISMSLGAQGISSNTTVDPAITYANNAGLVIFASSGNYYDPAYISGNTIQNSIGYPSNNQYVISVGASSPTGQRKSFTSSDGVVYYGSCYGSSTQDSNLAIDIMAPTELPSTDIQGTLGWNTGSTNNNYYWYFGGTSCACPYAAGSAALLLSADPDLTPTEIRTVLTSTATDMTIDGGAGWDMHTGYGLINIHAALNTLNLVAIDNPQTFAANPASTSQIDLSWTKNTSNDNVMVAWNTTSTFGTPAPGTTYSAGNSVPGGGTVLYNGSGTSYSHTGRNPYTTYYYKAWSVGDDGAKAVAYSSGLTASATTLADGTERVTFFSENWDGDLNDWYTAQTSQTNFWTIANATYSSSPYSAYITNSSTTLVNQYSNTTSVSHLFAPVYFPPGNTYQLQFSWKCAGQALNDVLEVFLVDTSTVPTAGTALSTTYRVGGPYNGQGTIWQNPTISLNNNNSGTTKLVVFSWKNNNTTRTNPPAAIDNIAISGILPNPLMGFADTEYDFGLAYIGDSNCTPREFIVGNIAGSTLTINSGGVALTGTDAAQFTLTDNNSYPINLTHGQIASWTVAFTPSAATAYGEKNAVLTIVDNAAKDFSQPVPEYPAWLSVLPRLTACPAPRGSAPAGRVASPQPKATNNINLRGFAVESETEDYFDSYADFALDSFGSWSFYDGDDSATYGITDVTYTNSGYNGSYLVFAPGSTTPALTDNAWQPYSGAKYLACFAASTPPNNDWLISPPIAFEFDPKISFYAKSITDQYGLERFKVLYSTAGSAYTNFTNYLAGSATTYVEAPLDWTLYEYELPESCENKTVWIAIQCVSNDAFAFFVDDFVAGDRDDDPTPVTLSSFTAMINASNNVRLDWVTQTESGVLGYYIHRSQDGDLATALQVSPLIDATNTSQEQYYSFSDPESQPGCDYDYWLQSLDLDGGMEFFGPVHITTPDHSPETPDIPLVTRLNSAYPNPFNPATTLSYSLAEPGTALLEVFNQRGQLVWSKTQNHSSAGNFRLEFDGRGPNGEPLASGIYLYRLSSGNYRQTRKMVLSK